MSRKKENIFLKQEKRIKEKNERQRVCKIPKQTKAFVKLKERGRDRGGERKRKGVGTKELYR